MTWEETIKYIRQKPEYKTLVEQAYFDEDLGLNVQRFEKSEEWLATMLLIKKYVPGASKILDVGCGNGITAVAFTHKGYEVTALEPDPSYTVGAGAINKLKHDLNLHNLQVLECFAEDANLPAGSFDVVYVRQAMHHAYDLKKFVANLARLLKSGGILLTIRDHVVYDVADKEMFLEVHPLQKFYGGENAFSSESYREAMTEAGLTIIQEMRYYDSAINYFPLTAEALKQQKDAILINMKKELKRKLGALALLPGVFALYKWKNSHSLMPDEKFIPGRMYSYIAKK